MDRQVDSGICESTLSASRHGDDSNGFVSRWSPVQSRVPAPDSNYSEALAESATAPPDLAPLSDPPPEREKSACGAVCSGNSGLIPSEEWRRVDGSDYEVSSAGRVRRFGRLVKDRPHPRGYRIVDVSVGGKAKSKTVHRLVALAFHGPALGRQVNHKNGNKADNRDLNLEWVSAKGNTAHAIATGLRRARGASEQAVSQ